MVPAEQKAVHTIAALIIVTIEVINIIPRNYQLFVVIFISCLLIAGDDVINAMTSPGCDFSAILQISGNHKSYSANKANVMTYPFIPIGLIAIFIVYVLYLLIIKRDMKKLKTVLYPGLSFIVIWAAIYYFWLK
jgi:hypothetical protein